MSPPGAFVFIIAASESGQRLDAVIAQRIEDCSRSLAARLVKSAEITINEAAVKPGYRVRIDDLVQGFIPPPVSIKYTPEPIPLNILFEDRHLIVVNKPAGLVVHPAPGHSSGTLVNGLLYHCKDLSGIGGELRPGIVHRLDKDTSGVLVVAKSDAAHANLGRQFKSRRVKKVYLALVQGIPRGKWGIIDLPIGRHALERKKMSIDAPRSRVARTRWRIQRAFKDSALLRIALETGRTHQIRVHLAGVGHPVIGDPVYGCRRQRSFPWPAGVVTPGRQMLHAFALGFEHPVRGGFVYFKAPPPGDMRALIQALGGKLNLHRQDAKHDRIDLKRLSIGNPP
ncbi:MAG: RluA family pseudouridine synthase [Desulfobacterales bacterium]